MARDGLAAATVRERAAEVLDRAPVVLSTRGFDPAALEPFRERLATVRLPADDLIALYEREPSIPAVLRHLAVLVPAKETRSKSVDRAAYAEVTRAAHEARPVLG